jgi:hypothetical protein
MCLNEGPDTIDAEPGMPNRLTRMQQIKISGFRWHHAPAAGRVENRSADFILQTLYPLSNRGPPNAKILPCGFEGAFIRHREDGDLFVHCYPEPTHSCTLKTEEAVRRPVVGNRRPVVIKRSVV